MATIRITPETLDSQAQKLDGLRTDHENLYRQIQDLVIGLASEWEGEANKTFTESFQSNDAAFKKFSQDIESFSKRMKTAAETMRQAEADVKNKMAQM